MGRIAKNRVAKSKFMEDFFYKAESICNYVNAKYYDNASKFELEKLYLKMKDHIGDNDIIFVYKFSNEGIKKYVALANVVKFRTSNNNINYELINPVWDKQSIDLHTYRANRSLTFVHCYLYFDSEKNKFELFNYNELKRVGLPRTQFEIHSDRIWSIYNNDIIIAKEIYRKQQEIIKTRTAIIEKAKDIANAMQNILKDNEISDDIEGEA